MPDRRVAEVVAVGSQAGSNLRNIAGVAEGHRGLPAMDEEPLTRVSYS